MRKEDSVSKLKLLLKMLDSQIKLDSGGRDSNSGMKEGVNMVRNTRMQEGVNMERSTKKPEDRMRHRSLSGSRQTLNFGPENINNDNEIEYNVAMALRKRMLPSRALGSYQSIARKKGRASSLLLFFHQH